MYWREILTIPPTGMICSTRIKHKHKCYKCKKSYYAEAQSPDLMCKKCRAIYKKNKEGDDMRNEVM